jgi:hypothetical protein
MEEPEILEMSEVPEDYEVVVTRKKQSSLTEVQEDQKVSTNDHDESPFSPDPGEHND